MTLGRQLNILRGDTGLVAVYSFKISKVVELNDGIDEQVPKKTVSSINQSINTLLTCCSLTSGVMAMQALPPAEARVVRTPDPRMKQ
jgi:hypothetical protein